MASRNSKDLYPALQPIYAQFIQECTAAGFDILCTCTWRSDTEQTALYNQGRTTPGNIVTNAKAGQSAHNFTVNDLPAAKAFDVVPLRNGKCVWDSHDPIWQAIGKIGMDLGLDWYGAPNARFSEKPHFQYNGD